MAAVLNSLDRAVRGFAPIDAVVSLAARTLLTKRTASACGIWCGNFCEVHYDWGQCTGGHPDYLITWYAADSFQPCPHDCGWVVGCCNH